MRLSGSTSLTGRVSSPRRSGTFSPVRNLYPPHNTVMFRHPDYAEDRDSLTSIMDPSGPARVKDPHLVSGHFPPGHFPPCSNQVGRTIPPLFLAGLGHFPSCNIIRGGHFPSHLFAQRGQYVCKV